MAIRARWQATITDDEGNVLPGASVEVRADTVGAPLAVLYADRVGLVAIGNPFTADAEGFAAFHAIGGAYKITVTSGAFSRVWRYVPVGLSAESDALVTGVGWIFQSATADADPGQGGIRFNNATLASVTTLYLDNLTPAGVDVSAWLDTFDNGGAAGNRGVIAIQTIDAAAIFIATVIGSVVVGTGYRKVTVTPISTAGTFGEGVSVFPVFTPAANNGLDGITSGIPFNFDSTTAMADPGTGDFRLNNATLSSVTAAAFDEQSANTGNPDVSAYLLAWDDSTTVTNRGFLLIKKAAAPQNFAIYRISGASTDNAGWTQLALTYVTHAGSFTNADPCLVEFSATGSANVGKQTIWVPATAMWKSNAASGPATGQFAAGASIVNYLAFDPSTFEDAFFTVAMPKSWDEGSISFQAYWMHPATTTNFGVVWAFFMKAYSDNDPIDGATFSAAGPVTDTGGTTADLYITAESSAAAVGGAAEGDLINFLVRRNATDGPDTLAVDAHLIGVKVFFTTNAGNDT